MTSITFALSDDSAIKLEELAKTIGIAPAELLRASVEEWLAHSGADFAEAATCVLKKNAELYRRLA
ncbi:MAG: DNA-binding protein [bacterium]